MSRTYFDAVLDKDMIPVFNGTPAETKTWIDENNTDESMTVCVGVSLAMMTVKDYREMVNNQ